MDVSKASSSVVQTTQQPTRLQKAEQAQRQTRQREVDNPPPPPPKPTVNTRGETTGRLVNVTA